jgi:hypothetical protein
MNPQTDNHGGVSKLKRYKWSEAGNPGALKLLSKAVLEVDQRYQREIESVAKIRKIASEFSWPAFGVISVAKRTDGSLFVFDGHHRTEAAKLRPDITHIPCIVYEMDSLQDEAKAFIMANTNRGAVTAKSKHVAEVTAEVEPAQYVDMLIRESGRTLSAKTSSPSTIACVRKIRNLVDRDRDIITRIWPVICEVTRGHIMHERLVGALFYIEEHMPDGDSLTMARWRSRLSKIGATELMLGINRASAFYSRGGDKVFAEGVLQAVNKGLQHKLELQA